MPDSFKFFINTSGDAYSVTIGDNIFFQPQSHDKSVWIIDETVARLHNDIFTSSFIGQRALESEKSLQTVALLLEKMRDSGSTQQTRIFAVGGGILQDLVTFSASCYMRGVRWVYYPTTLLSMVDSCIGGKSSINIGCYKNIAGNFYPPESVIIDVGFCDTLSVEQRIEGLCEAAKISYADADNTFTSYLALAKAVLEQPRGEHLVRFIQHTLLTKKRFIEEDEFDQGIRRLLNFGHTFGHAIEGATSYAISHGLAVGLGMLAAERFSLRLGYTKPELPNVEKLSAHIRGLLRLAPTLAGSLQRMDPIIAMECFESDKKHTVDFFTLVLFNWEGRLRQVRVPRSIQIKGELADTFQYLHELSYEI